MLSPIIVFVISARIAVAVHSIRRGKPWWAGWRPREFSLRAFSWNALALFAIASTLLGMLACGLSH